MTLARTQNSEQQPSNERIRGTVRWFNAGKGYGFISPAHGGKDIFVHFTAIQGDGYKQLTEGQVVEFEIAGSDKGPKADNVVVVG